MDDKMLVNEFMALPENLRQEVRDFIEFLKTKYGYQSENEGVSFSRKGINARVGGNIEKSDKERLLNAFEKVKEKEIFQKIEEVEDWQKGLRNEWN